MSRREKTATEANTRPITTRMRKTLTSPVASVLSRASARTWTTLSATALTAVVVVAMLLAGRATPRAARGPIEPLAGGAPARLAPAGLAEAPQPVERASGIYARVRGNHDRTVEFLADEAVPTGLDLLDVTRPRVRIHRTDGCVLELAADTGRVNAPDTNPRDGDLLGNVTITLYVVPDGDDADFSRDSPHRAFRIFMDRAHFDNQLGELRTRDEVLVRGRRIDFAGRGLTLTYNELQGRIDRLLIDEGQYLRFRPDRGAAAGRRRQDTGPGQAPEPAQARVFYRATLEHDVRIRSAGSTMTGDVIDVVFGLEGGGSAADAPGPEAPPTPSSPAEAAAEGDDVTITWAGPLVVVPASPAPHVADIDAQAFDATMGGTPVHIETADGQHIVARQVRFLAEAGRIEIEGDEQGPVRIDGPDIGELTVPRLTLDKAAGTARAAGRGRLRTPAGQPDPPQGDQVKAPATRLPTGLQVDWSRSVDLAFTPGEDGAGAIDRITFRGDVAVAHQAFDLKAADRLALGLTATGDQHTLQQIEADGGVSVQALGDDKDRRMSVDAQLVKVDLVPDADGRSRPAQLEAHGQVRLAQLDRRLEAGAVVVSFALPGEPAAPQADDRSAIAVELGADASDLRVSRMTAREDVRIRFEDQGRRFLVSATQIIADETEDRIELFGSESTAARIDREDVAVSGRYIVLAGKRDMHVIGPGTWTLQHLVKSRDARGRGAAGNADTTARLVVAWTESMRYLQDRQTVQFHGDVRADGRAGLDTTQLAGAHVVLELVPGGDQADLDGAERRIRRVVATEDVVFRAVQWKERIGGQVNTRLLIKGAEMVFTNTTPTGARVEQIRFPGAGAMQFEDNRPKAGQVAVPMPDARVRLSGAGVTAFTWRGELLLDALSNDMRLKDDVWMIHRPPARGDPIQISCDRFAADLSATGGLAAWTSGSAGQPAIETITAEQNVLITRDDATIQTGRVRYTRRDQFITLTPAPGLSTLITVGPRTSSYADPVYWNVHTNEFRAGSPGVLRVPLSGQ